MKHIYSLLILFSIVTFNPMKGYSQAATQTIRGMVTDKQSLSPIQQANISIVGSEPIISAYSDSSGAFKLMNIKPGRYEIKVTYMGYKEAIIPNVLVTAGKEIILEISMEEQVKSLKEFVVKGSKKNTPNNDMAIVSARSFSMEEVNRYSGGLSDPSRMVANFAGVSSPNDSRNDIVIRGNSPTGVLWRIEGLNIPNPNHFSSLGSTGGPVSALNTNILRNSDFFTSAYPAEYGNATAGVFDIGFRNGNTSKYENTLQMGAFTGLEGMTEGPLKKGSKASYLVAYRYSFTGLAQKAGIPVGTAATPFYQDLSFKFNSGYTKFGSFTLFGLGGLSKIEFKHDKIDKTDLFADPSRDTYDTSKIGLIGLKHFIRLNKNTYWNTVIGSTYSANSFAVDTLQKNDIPHRVQIATSKETRYSINTFLNAKINSRLTLKGGVQADLIGLDLLFQTRLYSPSWINIWDYKNNTTLMAAYMQAKYSATDKLTLNIGLRTQHLTLNNSTSFEPRAGLKYQINQKSSINVGYGYHSQMQTLNVYFFKQLNSDGTYDESNKNLGFTNNQHLVLGYDFLPAKNWRIKAETYYQMLNNVPISQSINSFSMLNEGASFVPTQIGNLVNKGTGTNYGLELTIEKFFANGYYGLFSGSLYESKYKGSDGIERNTAFNGNFVYNILGGKELKVGKEKRNTLTFDFKMSHAGGRHYTPVDLAASQAAHKEVLMSDAYAFSKKYSNFFRLNLKFGYTYNSPKRKLSQSIYFDIQNVTNNKNVFAQQYNTVTNQVNTSYQLGFFPNFVYKVQF